MALNSNNIYVGTAKMYFSVLDRDFDMLDRKSTITLNDIASFKASNESTFFGAYSSNSAVKAAAYNQLKVNSFNILNKIRTNGTVLQSISRYFHTNPNVTATLQSRADEVADQKDTIWLNQASNTFQKLYHFTINTKIYLPATFDTVTLAAEFLYKSNEGNGYYNPTVTFDYVT